MQDSRQKTLQYFLGLGLGLIPLLVFFPGIGLALQPAGTDVGIYLLFASLALYIAAIIAMTVYLAKQRLRFVGYGLLTLVVAAPIIAFISCTVLVFNSGQL